MNYQITYSKEFRKDIVVIYNDVYRASKEDLIAKNYVKELMQTVHSKLIFPRSNSRIDLFEEHEVRYFKYKKYKVFYLVKKDEIVVLRALHIARDITKLLEIE